MSRTTTPVLAIATAIAVLATAQIAIAQSVTATIPVGNGPAGAAANPLTGFVYVTNYNANTVSVIDGANNTVTATIPVGSGPLGVALNPSTHLIYVANFGGGNNVSVIDGTNNTVAATVTVGSCPDRVAVNAATNRIYVTNFCSNTVSVIDGANNTVVGTIAVGSNPSGVAVNPNTNRIYVSNSGTLPSTPGNTVSVIDGVTGALVNIIVVGTYPNGIAANPSTNRLYVANTLSANVSVIDDATMTVVATIPVPVNSGPLGIGIDPTTNRIAVADNFSSLVSFIDGATDAVVATVPVGTNPYDPAVMATTGRVYTPNFTDNTVSVIEDVVSPVATTTTVTSSANPSSYGQSVTFTATVSGSGGTPTGNVAFQADGNAISGCAAAPLVGGMAMCTTAALSAANHSITAAYGANGNFIGSSGALTQTVNQAALTITADNKTKVYGAALPALTVSYSGLVNGDTPASLTTPPSVTTTATSASHVAGSPYAITASGAVDADYAIAYVAGSLTVTPAPLTITADNKTKVVGAALPTLTVSYSGFVNGDAPASLATPPTVTTNATAASPVGSYAITANGAVDADYSMSYVAGTLTVTKAPPPTIEGLLAEVAGLNLNAGLKNSLTVKLQHALQSQANGDGISEFNQLVAFTNQLVALKKSGQLDASSADALIAQAYVIKSGIQLFNFCRFFHTCGGGVHTRK